MYVVMTVHFEMKLYHDQSNTQFFKFIYLVTSALHVAGFLLAHLQRQVYNLAVVQVPWVWCQRPGVDTIPRRLEPLPKLYACL
jgi:hypothetical protein